MKSKIEYGKAYSVPTVRAAVELFDAYHAQRLDNNRATRERTRYALKCYRYAVVSAEVDTAPNWATVIEVTPPAMVVTGNDDYINGEMYTEAVKCAVSVLRRLHAESGNPHIHRGQNELTRFNRWVEKYDKRMEMLSAIEYRLAHEDLTKAESKALTAQKKGIENALLESIGGDYADLVNVAYCTLLYWYRMTGCKAFDPVDGLTRDKWETVINADGSRTSRKIRNADGSTLEIDRTPFSLAFSECRAEIASMSYGVDRADPVSMSETESDSMERSFYHDGIYSTSTGAIIGSLTADTLDQSRGKAMRMVLDLAKVANKRDMDFLQMRIDGMGWNDIKAEFVAVYGFNAKNAGKRLRESRERLEKHALMLFGNKVDQYTREAVERREAAKKTLAERAEAQERARLAMRERDREAERRAGFERFVDYIDMVIERQEANHAAWLEFDAERRAEAAKLDGMTTEQREAYNMAKIEARRAAAKRAEAERRIALAEQRRADREAERKERAERHAREIRAARSADAIRTANALSDAWEFGEQADFTDEAMHQFRDAIAEYYGEY